MPQRSAWSRSLNNMNYPKAVYESGEEIRVGDHVQFKTWVEFWRGWIDGRVMFVPGISPFNSSLEYNGLKWVSIDCDKTKIAPLVDPDSGIVKKNRFCGRSKDDLSETPEGYEFPDDSEEIGAEGSRSTARLSSSGRHKLLCQYW